MKPAPQRLVEEDVLGRRRDQRRAGQRGVAMIVALLMVATLSFLALGVSQRTTIAIRRAAVSATASNAYWQSISASEAMDKALGDVLQASASDGGKLTLSHPLFLAPVDIPLPGGVASVRFVDATRCFNLNSLVSSDADGRAVANETAKGEFAVLARELGVSDATANRLASVIIDWIDPDAVQSIGGAEDGLYTALPSPFRTGGAPLGDVSEIRAMDGVTQKLYQGLEPYLCAHPETEPSVININMLQPEDAPLLAALTGGRVSAAEAIDIIDARPPGGWDNVDAFWTHPSLAVQEGDPPAPVNRTSITSAYIDVLARVVASDVVVAQRLTYQVSSDNGAAQLVARAFGDEL